MIGWADFIQTKGQVVAKAFGNLVTNIFFHASTACTENSQCHRLCAFDSFWMVMGDTGAGFRFLQNFLSSGKRPSDRADPHGCAIPEAIIRLGILGLHPDSETTAKIALRKVLCILVNIFLITAPVNDCICDCQRQDAIVGHPAGLAKKWEIRVFLFAVFINRSDNIPGKRSKQAIVSCCRHFNQSLFFLNNSRQTVHLPLTSRNACFTRSGVKGILRNRAPVASKIAFATAAAVVVVDGSPAPTAGRSGRLTSTISTSGTSENVRIGYVSQSILLMRISSNCTSSFSARLSCWYPPEPGQWR